MLEIRLDVIKRVWFSFFRYDGRRLLEGFGQIFQGLVFEGKGLEPIIAFALSNATTNMLQQFSDWCKSRKLKEFN